MNSKHIIIIACAALLGVAQANAQGQDLSVLAANPDARTAAMGNAAVATDGMYLYNNPSTPPLWATGLPVVMRHLQAFVMLVA